jgi:hypothetical protein
MRSLRAAITIVDPRVGVDYVMPLAEIDYVLMTVGARLDTTGLFRFIQDVVAVADGTAYSLTKPLSDAVTPPDAISVSALKALADGFAMNDGSEAVDGSTYSFSKGISNVTFTSDATTTTALKLLQDTQTLQDLVAKTPNKALADVFDLTDDETVAALKGLSDSVTMQDTIATLLIFIRNFSDTISVTDVDSRVFTLPKTEQIFVADTDNIDYQKNIADGFAMNDGSEAVDGSTYSFHKGISNVAFVGDVRSLIFAASRVESVAVADAGLLSVQDYCDLSYFAEDYVGLSQSF